MSDIIIREKLADLYERTKEVEISELDRIVFFSDLHLGDGGATDDFLGNSGMFLTVLERHYFKRGYTLVLNGDIEELQRFRLRDIMKQWTELYRILGRFHEAGRLYKIVGNHDYELLSIKPTRLPFPTVESIKFGCGEHRIFVIHGHQASGYLDKWHRFNTYALRYLANPLGIKNRSVAHDSRKQYKTERRIYDFSSQQKIITIIGHTHRPLFESHSKIDFLKFKIERHLRNYTGSGKRKQQRIRDEVAEYKRALAQLYEQDKAHSIETSLYNRLVVPSLFNAGCVIGKRGMTGIELKDGSIRLVHWFDRNTSVKYLDNDGDNLSHLEKTDYYRKVLKSDSLDYIFARIELLA